MQTGWGDETHLPSLPRLQNTKTVIVSAVNAQNILFSPKNYQPREDVTLS